jgi:hypothetical protein
MALRGLSRIIAIAATLVLTACANGPSHTPPVSERFSTQPICVERIALVANMPYEYTEKIAGPITSSLVSAFRDRGFEVRHEIQITNPLALGADVNLFRARQFRPQAYLIIKFAGSSVGSGYSYWNLRFELLNEEGQGIWRGATTLRRLGGIDKTAEQIAKELSDSLLHDQVITIGSKGESV